MATAVQIGYAVGIFLFVPLADRLHPRRQVTVQALALALILGASALMPHIVSVAMGFVCVGLVANIAQVLIPAANRMAPAGRRGITNGTLAGAMITGVFGGRILSSVLVEAMGWRGVVAVFAGIVLAAVPFLRHALSAAPTLDAPAATSRYASLLVGTIGLVRQSPALVESAVVQFFTFATFNSMWTVMVLHLTRPPFEWSVLQAGMFGLVGLAAGVATPLSGRFIDRFGHLPVAGVGLCIMLLATSAAILNSTVITAFAVSMFAVTLANQSIQAATQTRALNTNPAQQAQANTLYMMFVFAGGAVGAVLGPAAYDRGGMAIVAAQASALIVAGLLAWAVAVRRNRRSGQHVESNRTDTEVGASSRATEPAQPLRPAVSEFSEN